MVAAHIAEPEVRPLKISGPNKSESMRTDSDGPAGLGCAPLRGLYRANVGYLLRGLRPSEVTAVPRPGGSGLSRGPPDLVRQCVPQCVRRRSPRPADPRGIRGYYGLRCTGPPGDRCPDPARGRVVAGWSA